MSHTAHESRQGYRPDIDGLRAVAVLGVVLFHLNPSWLPGGFLGVDVFFVISGYLITGILLREDEAGGVRLGEFWKRRVRRLLPAFAVMAIGTCVLAALFFPPTLAYAAAKQTLAASCGVSNWYLSELTTSYWGQLASWAPLLHTWSLSVEEQFYLIFPFAFFLLSRLRSRTALLLALILAATASALVSAHAQEAEAARAFFLPFGRAWELLLGAIGALVGPAVTLLFLRRWGTLLGLCMIAGAYCVASGSGFRPWPTAAVAAFGALLICGSGGGQAVGASVLSAWSVRWVGRASYSIYLWHWPALVFGATFALAFPAGIHREAALGLGIGAGCLSYLYIEPLGRRGKFLTVGALILLALTLATALFMLRGPDPRVWTTCGGRDNPAAPFKPPAVLLVGDSHAETLAGPLRKRAESRGYGYVQHTGLGLAIVPERGRSTSERLASWRRAADTRDALVSRGGTAAIVISCRWDTYAAPQDLEAIETLLARWRGASPASRIVIVSQPALLRIGCFRASEWKDWSGRIAGAGAVVGFRRRDEVNRRLEELACRVGATVLAPDAVLGLAEGPSTGVFPPEVLDLYHDDNHLAEPGAERVAQAIMTALQEASAR